MQQASVFLFFLQTGTLRCCDVNNIDSTSKQRRVPGGRYVININNPWSMNHVYSRFYPRLQSRGGGYCHHHVWPCGLASVDISETASRVAFILHTRASFWGCRCDFLGYDLWLIFVPFDLEAIIDFNWWQMIISVSGRYLGKHLLDCFHTAHTHPSGGVDVPLLGVMTFDLIFNLWLCGHYYINFNYWRGISLASVLMVCTTETHLKLWVIVAIHNFKWVRT